MCGDAVECLLVGSIVDVWRCLRHQQRCKLQQQDAHGVRGSKRIVWVDDIADEDADDVLSVLLVRHRRPPDEPFTLLLLKGVGEARDEHALQDLCRREEKV